MTNEEKINLIGQKMLVLSSNLEKYQAELQLLKIQLLQLQQQNLAFQKHTPPPISQTPVPKEKRIVGKDRKTVRRKLDRDFGLHYFSYWCRVSGNLRGT